MEKLRIEDGGLNQRSEVRSQKWEMRNEELKLKIEIMAEVKVKGQKSEMRNEKQEMVNGKW